MTPPLKETAFKRSMPKHFDHIPIIIFLLVICGFAILCIGIGLTWFFNMPDVRSNTDYQLTNTAHE